MMYQRPQTTRNNKLSQVDAKSAYFTHIEPPPSPSQMNYQYSNGYGGRYAGDSPVPSPPSSASSPSPFSKPLNGYGSPPPPPPPSQQQAPHLYAQHTGELYKPSRRRPSHYGGGGSGCLSFMGTTMLLLLWTIALAGGGYYWYMTKQVPLWQHEIQHWQRKFETMEDLNAELESHQQKHMEHANANQQLEHESRQLQQQIQQLQNSMKMTQSQRLEASNRAQQLQQELEQVRQTTQEQLNSLTREIQHQSKLHVLNNYGAGPFKVEFEVQFPQDDHPFFFVVELAPLDLMPHAISIFLQQVRSGLFNDGGFAFHHNGQHITFGSPIPNMLTHPNGVEDFAHAEDYLVRRFQDSGFGHLLFVEYSHEFPHTEYTLAFAGRPGGPGFYINTVDNQHLHGPGGYAQDGNGDTCFAKVVSGIDVIQRMHQSSGDNLQDGDWRELTHGAVAVRTAKIL